MLRCPKHRFSELMRIIGRERFKHFIKECRLYVLVKVKVKAVDFISPLTFTFQECPTHFSLTHYWISSIVRDGHLMIYTGSSLINFSVIEREEGSKKMSDYKKVQYFMYFFWYNICLATFFLKALFTTWICNKLVSRFFIKAVFFIFLHMAQKLFPICLQCTCICLS